MRKRVAIIGFSFRFPGTDPLRFWSDLLHARDLVTQADPERWTLGAFRHPNKAHPGASYTFAAGSIGDVAGFDADFFGISPREAALMDPQQRLLLELGWEVLENAGILPSRLQGSNCGVYIGISNSDYAYRLADDLAAIDSSVITGNSFSIAANRLSYYFDLHGPSMAIDTGCSAALVAFHQACRSIISGETSQALAGGVNLHLHPYGFICFSKASMLSHQGHCKVFDAAADGFVRSEGGGLFLLKDYHRALADGDRILAVVAGSLVNTDGRKTGMTVPCPKSQALLLEQAYHQAGIAPEDIDYLEAHGTGTAVGDPIETRAIGEALGKRRPAGQPLPIGSIKSNLGHLEAAAGVAGLVKALYCIQHRLVPATIGLETPNPHIPFADLNLQVVTANRPLKNSGKIIVGINSFGFGGANAHVILESEESCQTSFPAPPQGKALPIVLSAKTEVALKAAAQEFSQFLSAQSQESLYDIAYSTVFHREWHKERALVFGSTPTAIAQDLRDYANGSPGGLAVETGCKLEDPIGPAFIYSGNGSHWVRMSRRLALKVPLFRETMREIDAIFSHYADFSLEDELTGKNGDRFELTEIGQPALFVFQVFVTLMLRSRGIIPAALAGHSVGEVAAAWASGALSLEDAIRVIYHRSRLQGATKGCGQITAVGLGAQAACSLLNENGWSTALALTGINSYKGVTIAGPPDKLSGLEAVLAERGILFKRLELDYAFHSPVMDDIQKKVILELAHLQPGGTHVPLYSTLTGCLLDGRKFDANHWGRHLRQPVLFEQTIKAMLAKKINVFIEIGPNAILRGYINDCLNDSGVTGRVITTNLRDDDDPQKIFGAASQAAIAGAPVDWKGLFPFQGRLVPLPNYPWQREHHWHPVTPESCGVIRRPKIHPLLGSRLPQHDLTWENQLDTQLHHTLGDHVIGDAVVFPGTGFAELALAAALAWQPGEYAEIEGLEIRSPLLLGSGTKTVRLSISEPDGSFTIKGREYCSSETWGLHAVGRILPEPGEALLKQQPSVIPTRTPDFDGRGHEALTQAAGLGYGPAFQAIDHGWVEHGSALAVYATPPPIATELEHHHLHPALLDCAFQLIIHLLKDDPALRAAGVIFIPSKIGRIAFRTTKARPHCASATMVRRSPHSITADFTIFAEDGSPIAVIKQAHFRGIRLYKGNAQKYSFLDYRCTPKPHPLAGPAAAAPSFEQVRQATAGALERCVFEGTHRRYAEEIDPLLDSLCSSFISEALEAMAGDRRHLPFEVIQALQDGNPETVPFWHYLLDTALKDGTIESDETGWRLVPDDDTEVTAREIWTSLFVNYPDYFPIIQAVGRVGMHLRELLEGRLTAAQVCPEATRRSAFMSVVLGQTARYEVGRALEKLIAAGVTGLEEGRRLGVLEISEGPPAFAAELCRILDFNRSDYVFATTSAAATDEAKHLLENFPATDIRQIDDTAATAGACRLAIVTCDFATIEEAGKALKYARSRLAPGGSLVLLSNHPTRWLDFTLGARPGYWVDLISELVISPQQTASFWQQQLKELGYTSSELLEFAPQMASGPYLLVAHCESAAREAAIRSPEPEREVRNWLIIADQEGYSARLAASLSRLLESPGDRIRQISAGDSGDIAAKLAEFRDGYGEVHGVVYLAGLNTLSATSEAAACLAAQVERCAGTAALIQACEATQTGATCWLITTGAASHLLPRRDSARGRSPAAIADAALWGFGATLMNEASSYAVRLIDLEDPEALEMVATALRRELSQPDDEREIIITASGARFAPRLQFAPRPETMTEISAQDTEVPAWRLGFQFPGQLKNLRWEAYTPAQAADDELEIEIRATGLNFRDIMYTSGLLSDEAIENGFLGPTLGLEFAGVVLKAGSLTTGFSPGDRVMGFAPASFSNRVVTKAGTVGHIPAELSFEAAATIPTTFFTAYYALHHLARLQPGERVLIHGAAGGVGIAAIQVARWKGAEIYATAGSEEKRDFLRLLGAEHIYHSRSLAFADQILADTGGEGVDVVLNSLSGEVLNRNLRVLKPFGRFLELGKRDFYENTKIGLHPFRNNISYFGIDVDQLIDNHAEFARRLFGEIVDLFAEGAFYPLPYSQFEAADIIDAFRYMQQARHIGKIVVTYRNGVTDVHHPLQRRSDKLKLSAEASYLVTGGLSGFGLKTAEWLVAQGARNLILISRSGPASPEAQEAISRLELEQGVRILAAPCDVTDQTALSTLLERASSVLPPLKGIVHAAAVIADGLVRNLNAEQISRVLAPKVLGAYCLHELTQGMPLDFFILYSSATTLFGNPGQGAYVAANTWLEALAQLRRAAGLPATCVLWGAIEDAGFLARNQEVKDALMSRMGGSALKSANALDILESLLFDDHSGVGVLDFDWKALRRFLPGAELPKFSDMHLLVSDADPEDGHSKDFQSLLKELSDAELRDAIADLLKGEIGQILRISPGKIDINRSLYDMGMDSLMGVELVVAIESRFGIQVPVMALSDSPTISELAAFILKQVRGAEAPDVAEAAAVSDTHAQVQEVVSQHGVEAAQDDIASFAMEIDSEEGFKARLEVH